MPTRDDAVKLATELLALDVKARTQGTSVVDLLANLARTTYGVDVRPTAAEIEAAGEPELEALKEDDVTAADITAAGGALDTQPGGAA